MRQFLTRLKISLLLIALSACTTSTGIDISQNHIDQSFYKQQNNFYFYRTACHAGAIANIILEVNGSNVGILGSGEILVSEIIDDTSNIVAYGDLNAQNYFLYLETGSKESRYLIASYCNKFSRLKIVEKPLGEWLQIIKND